MRYLSQINHSAGFTLIEVLIIAPIVVIAISGFIALMVATVGDVLISRDQSAATYNANNALDIIEQDVRLSADFLTTSGSLPSPQGKDTNFTGTAAFTSSEANTLVLSTLVTDENPANTNRRTLYYANQPHPCGNLQIYNKAFLAKVIYFIKDGSLWRRSYVPDWNVNSTPDANTLCTTASYPPWQQNSCSPGYVATRCKTNDAKVADNVTALTTEYYTAPGDTTAIGAGNASSASTVNVTITGSKTTAGRSIATNASRRATKLNNVNEQDSVTSFVLANGWTNHDGGYQTYMARKTTSGAVFLNGLIKGGSLTSGSVIGYLLPDYRPAEHLIFSVSTRTVGGVGGDSGPARVDVMPNGEVRFMNGSPNSSDWLSLDGISFMPTSASPSWSNITLQNGWTNYGGEYSDLKSAKDTIGRVHLQGLVKQGTFTEGTTIGVPGSTSQSADYLTFSATGGPWAYNSFGVRSTFGVRARDISSTWLAIQGMYYPGTVGTWTNLTLQNSWVEYANTYATPQRTKAADGVVTLRGRIKSGTTTNGTAITTLPVGLRPSKTLMFNLVTYDDTYARVDILNDGRVMIRHANATWLSLDGISFVADQ